MEKSQRGPNVHTLTIQQTYWAKETSEKDLMKMGGVCLDKVEEQVDYYDTEGYDLAVTDTWLSKTGDNWRLIVGKSDQVNPAPAAKPSRNERSVNGRLSDNRRGEKPAKRYDRDGLTTAQKGNKVSEETDGPGRRVSTCYELADESEIAGHLSNVLQHLKDPNWTSMSDVLQSSGIRRYASFVVTNHVTYKVRDLYSISLAPDRKAAVVSLQVDIEDVMEGFQRLEELANELDLQLQNM